MCVCVCVCGERERERERERVRERCCFIFLDIVIQIPCLPWESYIFSSKAKLRSYNTN